MSRKPSSTSNVVARGGYAARRAQTGTFNVVMRLDDKVVGTLGPYQTRRAALADARTLAYRKADTTGIVTLKSGNKAPLARVHRDFSDPKGLVESGYYLKSRRGKAQPLGFDFEVEVMDAHRSPVRPNPRRNGSMPHHTEVQALLFHKAGFPVGKAKSWAKHHGFHYGRVEKGGERSHMLRLRQNDPADYVPGSFRTISLADGVEAVIGLPKRAA
jgi:hypothetical protein